METTLKHKTLLFTCLMFIILTLTACMPTYTDIVKPSYCVAYYTNGGSYFVGTGYAFNTSNIYSSYDDAVKVATDLAIDGYPSYIFKTYAKIEVPPQQKTETPKKDVIITIIEGE